MNMKLCFIFDKYGEFIGIGDTNFYCIDEYVHFDNFHDACKFYTTFHASKKSKEKINALFDEIQKKLYEP